MTGYKENKTIKKFIAGNVIANQNVRSISPLSVNFKWTPFSVKSDFVKIPSSNNQNIDITR